MNYTANKSLNIAKYTQTTLERLSIVTIKPLNYRIITTKFKFFTSNFFLKARCQLSINLETKFFHIELEKRLNCNNLIV